MDEDTKQSSLHAVIMVTLDGIKWAAKRHELTPIEEIEFAVDVANGIFAAYEEMRKERMEE